MSILVHTNHITPKLPINGSLIETKVATGYNVNTADYVDFNIEQTESVHGTNSVMTILTEETSLAITSGSVYISAFNGKDIFYSYVYDSIPYAFLINQNGGNPIIVDQQINPLNMAGVYVAAVALTPKKLFALYQTLESKEIYVIIITTVGGRLYFQNLGRWLDYASIARGSNRINEYCVLKTIDSNRCIMAVTYGTSRPALVVEFEITNSTFIVNDMTNILNAKNIDIAELSVMDENNIMVSCVDGTTSNKYIYFYHLRKIEGKWTKYKQYSRAYTSFVAVSHIDNSTYLVYDKHDSAVWVATIKYVNEVFTAYSEVQVVAKTSYFFITRKIDSTHMATVAFLNDDSLCGYILTTDSSGVVLSASSATVLLTECEFESSNMCLLVLPDFQIIFTGAYPKRTAYLANRIQYYTYLCSNLSFSNTGLFPTYSDVVYPSVIADGYYGVALHSAKSGAKVSVYVNN